MSSTCNSNVELDIVWGSVECDPVYSTVYHLTLRGWPDHWQQVPLITRIWSTPQWTWACIPPELLDHTLADLHGAYQEINRMQAQEREAVYWSGIDVDIVNYIHWCIIYTKHKASPPAQPMLPRDIPDGPWKEMVANYLTHKGKEYLLLWNLFSKYPFLYKVSTKSAQSLSMHLQELISQYRLPCILYTDTGPLFAYDELLQFCQPHRIDHITSFLHFPMSNVFIECQVRTIKRVLSTTQES